MWLYNDEFANFAMRCILERKTVAMREDFTHWQYLDNMVKSRFYLSLQIQQLEDRCHIDLVPCDVQVAMEELSLKAPLLAWASPFMVIPGSWRDRKYLGQYNNLFESIPNFEAKIPTWQAMAWILKDYGMSHTEYISWDLEYKSLLDATWTIDASPSVVMNGNFCKCPCRHK